MSILAGIPPTPHITKIPTDELEALKAENVALRGALKLKIKDQLRLRGGGWLPIESAHKDGTEILISTSGAVYAATWHNNREWLPVGEDNYYSEWESFKDGEVTHWQPMPLPPKPEGESDA